nr:hypothetical protein [Tanacetum cinerariifolium]
MASSTSPSTKNPPRKIARTNIIDISSNESSPLQKNNLITTIITITLSLSLALPIASQTPPSQPIEASPLAPRELLFSTPPSSPHPYLNSLDDLLPRNNNSPPPPLDQAKYQTLPHTTLMDFEPFFAPTNLSRRSNRLSAHQEPFMSQEQILEEMGQLQNLSQNIKIALHNAQIMKNSLLPLITSSYLQMPPLPSSLHLTITSTTDIPPF